AYWYKPESWHGPEELARYLAAELRVIYYVTLINFYPQLLVLEGLSLRQAWTHSRQLPASAMGRLGWVLGIGVLLMQAGHWAEVLGSGLTNLLCMVGVTGVYWEERGREEKIREEEEE
ncbi:MAG: hypothetical protein HY681_11745, partial [Chloroflexi bacterium]|nr:hypothetical protein [Chloroflexota bacterium]